MWWEIPFLIQLAPPFPLIITVPTLTSTAKPLSQTSAVHQQLCTAISGLHKSNQSAVDRQEA